MLSEVSCTCTSMCYYIMVIKHSSVHGLIMTPVNMCSKKLLSKVLIV